MRRLYTAIVTLLILMLLASPALAGVTFQVNGKSYQPAASAQLVKGTTMIPVSMVQRIIGADINTAKNIISIRNNTDVLNLTLGSKTAKLNGKNITLPQAPVSQYGQVMVPVKPVLEAFGAKLGYESKTQTCTISYYEKRGGLTAMDILAKSNEAMAKHNICKMKGNIEQQMSMSNPDDPKEPLNMTAKTYMDMAVQTKPLLMYGKMDMTMSQAGKAPEKTNMEMVIQDNALYMLIPQQGWVKMDMAGIDLEALLEQSGAQNPVNSLKQMMDAGVVITLENDRQKNGRSYWAVTSIMGSDALSKLMDGIMKNPGFGGSNAPEVRDMFKNMQGDCVYTVLVDQQSFLPASMTMDIKMNLNTSIPTEQGKSVTLNMNMVEKGDIEIYGLDEPFTVPDVSQAKPMPKQG